MLQLLAQTSSDYLYETTTTPISEGEANAYMGFFALLMIPLVILAIVTLAGMWKVFTKAGKPGWAVLIPIYNYIVLVQVAGLPMWWVAIGLLGFIPVFGIGTIAGLAFSIVTGINVAKKFGKDTTWGVFLLGILPFIGYPKLGFGADQYQGSDGVGAGTPTAGSPTSPTAPTTPTTTPTA